LGLHFDQLAGHELVEAEEAELAGGFKGWLDHG
jgi:hypothetical protein